jgi:formate dehydrogenase major subunit
MSEIHLTINGQPVTAQVGQTVLEAARGAGIDIPTLCHHPALSNHGACRMCLVEVEGMRGLQTSCTCPVTEGMRVHTETEQVREGRKFALELLFSERNHFCMYCQVSGDCELQDLAYRYGLDHWRYPRPTEKKEVDASHPYIIMEPNRCILCTRCVRACAELAACHTLGLRERGSRTMIMADLDVPLGLSTCVSCGACLQVCPTGALIDAASAYGGHEEELTHTTTTCMQCSVGCALDVVTRANRLLRIEGIWDSEPSGGLLCVDGRFKPVYERRPRITHPLVRHDGRLVETSWDEALGLAAGRLGSGSVVGLAASSTSNEALAAFAKLFEGAGRLEPAAPKLGRAKPAQVNDVLDADLIVVAGVDPLISHRVIGYLIKRAVDNGTTLALVGEIKSGLNPYASLIATEQNAHELTEQAAGANKAVVVYGTELQPAEMELLRVLADHALFLRLDEAHNGRGAEAAGLAPRNTEEADSLVLLLGESDDRSGMATRLNGAFTVALASYRSSLVAQADVVLPTPIWAERSGHFTNVEGKVLPLHPAIPMPDQVRDEVQILADLASMMNN